MNNFFDKSLHYLGKNKNDVFVMNIGAMDGVLFDEMIGYTNVYGFNGLYVEPIPYLFEKLKQNIKNGIFENSAISDYDGEIDMITIKKEVIDNNTVHNCFYGMSAVYPPKNGLGSEFDRPTVEKYGEIVKVKCITYKTLLDKHNISNVDVIKIDAEGHDYKIFKQIDLTKNNLKVIRLEWINLSEYEQNQIKETFKSNNFKYEISGQDIVGVNPDFYDILLKNYVTKSDIKQSISKITLVTGLWDIKRNELSEGWKRDYQQHYLPKFEELLKVKENLIIFGDEELETFVWSKRKKENTQFIRRDLNWFKGEFYEKIQKIRTDENWLSQAGWLRDSTQAKLEMYNPIVMSKMYLLHDAKILDTFNSEYMFWIDAGLTNTVHPGYFTHDHVLDKLVKSINKFFFVCFPYDAVSEIHGFDYVKINELTKNKVNKVARGGFFGGPKHAITDINNVYYNLMSSTLNSGYMGTEESLFTIMCYNNSNIVDYFEIDYNGLLSKFFEDLKNENVLIKNENKKIITTNKNNVALYVVTYNSPKQFEKLCQSFEEYDESFIKKPKKYLINNSLNDKTFYDYDFLCDKFGFEEIHKNNIGICGARQFIAEHAEENNFDFYFFFEDDMFFYLGKEHFCKNGFTRKIENFYEKTMSLMQKENFDFLKWNFTEFFGENSKQWAWYNVPQEVREKCFPQNPNKSENDYGKEPFTTFKNIKSHMGLPYATGEIYYCNWPQTVSKEGNRKMFLETKWAHPYEQTWMSYIYQETTKGKIYPGILLATPTEHDRFEFYPREERREN